MILFSNVIWPRTNTRDQGFHISRSKFPQWKCNDQEIGIRKQEFQFTFPEHIPKIVSFLKEGNFSGNRKFSGTLSGNQKIFCDTYQKSKKFLYHVFEIGKIFGALSGKIYVKRSGDRNIFCILFHNLESFRNTFQKSEKFPYHIPETDKISTMNLFKT